MTEEIASQEIDFMEYGDTQINTIDMERGQRKDLIGKMLKLPLTDREIPRRE